MTPKRNNTAEANDRSTAPKPAKSDNPSSAPELDPTLIEQQEQAEVTAAFTTEPEADVVAELPDETSADAAKAAAGSADDLSDAVDAEAGDSDDRTAPKPPGPVKRFLRAYGRRWKWTIPLTLLVIAGIILAVPASRYPALGLFVKNGMLVTVIDDRTNQPVASVVVELDGKKAMTDKDGKVTIESKVGQRLLKANKRYYRDASSHVFVPITDKNNRFEIRLTATGRQVPLSVTNQLTGKPLENVLIKAADTEARTDKNGQVLLVLPADRPTREAELSLDKYNGLKATITVTEGEAAQNKLRMTPAGKLYFLSKKSGAIDVVKTNLDGSDRQTVLAGTGREEDAGTVLLASRDWKYLALLSRRDSDKPKLYLITTDNDKLSVMDEGNAGFQPIGWSDQTFAYAVTRNAQALWQPNRQAIKSYNAASGKLSTLDQTQAEGDQYTNKYQQFLNFYLVGNKVIYLADWTTASFYYTPEAESGKVDVIRSINVNGTERKELRSFNSDKFYGYEARSYKPREVYFSAYSVDSKSTTFYEYEDGVVKPVTLDENAFFNKVYPTYLESPSGKRVFWSDQRDGKDTFFTGSDKADNAKQVATLDEHQPYGWYSDDYLLVSKGGSELYIMPADGGKLTKVTDYHKPSVTFRGYGGGYGGL